MAYSDPNLLDKQLATVQDIIDHAMREVDKARCIDLENRGLDKSFNEKLIENRSGSVG